MLPAMTMVLLGTLLLSWVYAFVYRRFGERYLLLWALAWAVSAARYGLDLAHLAHPSPWLQACVHLAAVVSGTLLWWGAQEYVGRRLPRLAWAVTAIVVVLTVAATAVGLPFMWRSIPSFLYLGVIFIWTGWLYWSQRGSDWMAQRVLGGAFVLWGLHKLDYPLLRPLPSVAPWGYLLAALLETVVAMGTLLLYLAHVHRELRASEERFRHLAENARDLIYRYRLRPVPAVEYVSPSTTTFTGYSPEEWYEDPDVLDRLIHPDDRRLWQAALEQLDSPVPFLTLRWRKKDGNVIWVEQQIAAVTDRSGAIVGFEAVARDITVRRRAEEEVHRRAAHLEMLNAVITAAAGATRLDDLLRDVLDRCMQVLECTAAAAWVSGRWTVRGHVAADPASLADVAQALLDEARQLTVPISVDDWSTFSGTDDSAWSGLATRLGARATLIAAVSGEDETLGWLLLGSEKPRRWRAEEVRLLQSVGWQLGTAARRLYLMEELRRRLEEVSLLSRVIMVTATAIDMEEALTDICEELARFFHVPQAAFARMYPGQDHTVVVAEYRAPGRPSALGQRIPVDGNPSMAYILTHRRPLAIEDAQHDPRMEPVWPLMRQRGVASILIAPILVRGELVGTLGIDSTTPRAFAPAEIDLVQRVADQVGQAMERLRLYEEAQQRADRMETLARLAERLSRRLEPTDVAAAIGDGARVLSQADGVALCQVTAGEAPQVLWWHGVEPSLACRVVPRDREVHRREVRLHAEKWAEAIGWPLTFEERTNAWILCFYRKSTPAGVPPRDIMEAFARQAAVALENARLYTSLQAANVQLKQALKAKDEMLQNVSHELRTPLGVILGYTELLEQEALGPLTETMSSAIESIHQQGRRLAYMVDRLLLLQSLDTRPLEQVEMDVTILLRASVDAWRSRPHSEKLTFELETPRDLPPVLVDPDLLSHVLENLLDNAVKFSPQGGTITVGARAAESEVIVWVSDQGVGIPADKMADLGDLFHQVDGSSTRRFGGMGIGLALCRRILELHGGRMWAHSEGANRGATFYFSLPLAAKPS